MSIHSAPNRIHLFPMYLLVFIAAASASIAEAAEVTWTGAANTLWSNPGNWTSGVPLPDDLVIVPTAARQPEVDDGITVCGGLILEENATLRVLGSAVLYIIGPGDLDHDGISDVAERDASEAADNYDTDEDGIPNFAETDSDSDGMSDACEFQYGSILEPYARPDDPSEDHDGDGYTDLEECVGGSDPTDPNSIPPEDLSAAGAFGLSAVCLLLTVGAILTLRKTGPRGRKSLLLLLLVALMLMSMPAGSRPALAASLSVDFALGHTIPGKADAASSGDTLVINGGSSRPWNGCSTYVIKPLRLRASGGAIFLGGVRADFTLCVLGQGSIEAKSVYQASDHPKRISVLLQAGTKSYTGFLGERFTLTAAGDTGWVFRKWVDDVSRNDNLLSFQAVRHGLRATALFGPTEPDLALTVDTGPPDVLYAGNTVVLTVRVTNIGQTDTPESEWEDGFYLSRDALFDAADFELGVTTHSEALEANEEYSATLSAGLPDVAPGCYSILGVTDTGLDVTDANRDNNVVASGVVVLDANLAR